MEAVSTPTRPQSIFPVLLVNFIGMMGYSIVIPLLVFLIERFSGGEQLGVNEILFGVLGAVYPTFQLVGAPLLGKWSDSVGRKRVLLVSQIGTLMAWLLFIWALLMPTEALLEVNSPILGSFLLTFPLILLFIARALDGLTGGNVSVANAYLSDVSTDANRKGNFGKMASSTSLGFIVGPMIASLLGGTEYGELLPVMAAAGISFVAVLVIQFYLPESLHRPVDPNIEPFKLGKMFQIEHKECYEMENCPEEAGFKDILKMKDIPLMYVIYFLTFLGFSFFYSAFPLYAVESLAWTSAELGVFFTITSGVMVLFQGPVLTFLSRRVSDGFLVILGSLLIGISFFLIPVAGSFWVYGAVTILAAGNGLMWPSYLSILSTKGDSSKQGLIQGYANSMGSAASICGLIVGSVLFKALGSMLFGVAGIMLMLIFVLAFRLK
ncbi:MAG: MFS transporter [Bacteroidota bacterium]